MYANRFFTLLVVITLVVVVALTVREALATSAIALSPQEREALRLQHSRATDAARWTAMAEYYERFDGAQNMERRRNAETVRWNAMAKYYEQLREAQLQRSLAADTARWNAMAEYYKKQSKPGPELSVPAKHD